MGHIKKLNGKKAGAKTHLLADTIMETAYGAVWLMQEDGLKKLIKSIWTDMTDEELDGFCIHELTERAAFLIGIKTWSEGYYADLDVEPSSVVNYMINWGE
jgi:hypothetical protein